jgi:hypothetical protein
VAKKKAKNKIVKPKEDQKIDGLDMPFEDIMKILVHPEVKENKNKKI